MIVSARMNSAMHASVLVLNRNFMATHVVSVRRTFCLLWKGDVEVIHIEQQTYIGYDFDAWREVSEMKAELDEWQHADEWIHTVSFPIQIPRIIRLLNYDRIPRNTVAFNRRNVFLRDGNQCQYCGRKLGVQSLSLDHVLPRSRGGQSTWENIVAACLKCNVTKGGRTPQEAGMRLRQKPAKPKRNPALAVHVDSTKYESWRRFLD